MKSRREDLIITSSSSSLDWHPLYHWKEQLADEELTHLYSYLPILPTCNSSIWPILGSKYTCAVSNSPPFLLTPPTHLSLQHMAYIRQQRHLCSLTHILSHPVSSSPTACVSQSMIFMCLRKIELVCKRENL